MHSTVDVAGLLANAGWRPEQIAGRLQEMPQKGLRRVCHETIYAFIYRTAQKAEKLRKLLVRWRSLQTRTAGDRIKDKVHINERSTRASRKLP